MHALLFTPKPVRLDASWGSDVISEVNSRLDLDLQYTPAQTSQRASILPSSKRSLRQVASFISATPEKDRRQSRRRENQSEPELTRSTLHQMCTANEFDSFDPGTERCKTPRYQGNVSTFRLPDLIKRVLAAPNCLTPESTSPQRPCRALPRPLLERFRDQQQRRIIDQAVFGPPNVKRDVKVAPTELNNQHRVPWQSVDTAGQVPSIARTNPKLWSGIDQWQGLPIPPDRRDLADARRAFIYSKSVYSDVHSASSSVVASAEQLPIHNDSTTSLRRVEQDIATFLASAPTHQPLNAEEITILCEAGCDIPETLAQDLNKQTTSFKAKRNSNLLENIRFRPRRTIGKSRNSDSEESQQYV